MTSSIIVVAVLLCVFIVIAYFICWLVGYFDNPDELGTRYVSEHVLERLNKRDIEGAKRFLRNNPCKEDCKIWERIAQEEQVLND